MENQHAVPAQDASHTNPGTPYTAKGRQISQRPQNAPGARFQRKFRVSCYADPTATPRLTATPRTPRHHRRSCVAKRAVHRSNRRTTNHAHPTTGTGNRLSLWCNKGPKMAAPRIQKLAGNRPDYGRGCYSGPRLAEQGHCRYRIFGKRTSNCRQPSDAAGPCSR